MDDNRPYDFAGWATRNNIKCADGRTIRPNAFADNDGDTVPLVYNHSHSDIFDVLGHTVLENHPEGVRCYGWFNDTDAGKQAKAAVENGDINALSIYANQLKQNNGDVIHGNIREVSLVLAGANPGAYIDSYVSHSEESDEEAMIYTDTTLELFHADSTGETGKENSMADEANKSDDKTLQDVFDGMSEEQKQCTLAMMGLAVKDALKNISKDKEGDDNMKHSVFETENNENGGVLAHSEQKAIIELAKQTGVGSLKDAIAMYETENNCTLAHGFEGIDQLFPEYKNLDNGKPETITRDYTWVDTVVDGAHKSPATRIRTRQIDARMSTLKALGYITGEKKKDMGVMKLLKRTTDPQTVYVKDTLNRDDILDVEDFDYVEYEWGVMRDIYRETIGLAILVGDQRDDEDPDKISEEHIRPIWTDDDLYVIHKDVDVASLKNSLQGTDTSKSFGDEFIYSEAAVKAILDAKIKYKGKGSTKAFMAPTLKNTMMLARDITGNRMYHGDSDLASAISVGSIQTVEQFEGLVRTTKDGKKKKLLAIIYNPSDYQLGAGKGGELTKFSDFDINFNKEIMLMEGRCSGTLTNILSAIILEEDVTEAAG